MTDERDLYNRMLEAQQQMTEESQSGQNTPTRRRTLPATPNSLGTGTPYRRRRSLPVTPLEVPPQTFFDCRDFVQGDRDTDNHINPSGNGTFRPVHSASKFIPQPLPLLRNGNPYDPERNNPLVDNSGVMFKEPQKPKEIFAMKPKMKPREYNGSSPWEEYWLHFKQVAMINRWSDEDSRQYLLVNLSGIALEFAFTLAETTRESFPKLTDALGQRFGSAREAMVHQAALENIRRKPGQTIPALGQEIRRKVRLAYPGADLAAQEALAINNFRRAVTDATQRMFICNSEPKTLDKAMEAALRAEAYESLEEDREKPRRVRQIETVSELQEIREQYATIREEINQIINKEKPMSFPKNKESTNPNPSQTTAEIKNVQKTQTSEKEELEKARMRIKELEEKLRIRENQKKLICQNCDKPGHTSKVCWNYVPRPQDTRYSPGPRPNPACYTCNQPGHMARECPRNRQQTPEGRASRAPPQREGTIKREQMLSSLVSEEPPNRWLDPTVPPFCPQTIRKQVEVHGDCQVIASTPPVLKQKGTPSRYVLNDQPLEIGTISVVSRVEQKDLPIPKIPSLVEEKKSEPLLLVTKRNTAKEAVAQCKNQEETPKRPGKKRRKKNKKKVLGLKIPVCENIVSFFHMVFSGILMCACYTITAIVPVGWRENIGPQITVCDNCKDVAKTGLSSPRLPNAHPRREKEHERRSGRHNCRPKVR